VLADGRGDSNITLWSGLDILNATQLSGRRSGAPNTPAAKLVE